MKLISLTTLTTKLTMLLCVSCMGFLSVVEEAFGTKNIPCHQMAEVTTEENTAPCEMCVQALEAWEQEATSAETITIKDITDLGKIISDASNFALNFSSQILENYLAYYPPPQVLWKSAQPTTKTTVLLI